MNEAMKCINGNYQAELQGKSDEKTGLPMVKMNNETREWEVLPEFRSLAIKEGWDKPTYIQTQLDQMKINYTVNKVKKGTISTDMANTTQIE